LNKKRFLIYLGIGLLLTGCGTDSEADIVNDVEAQQFNAERLGAPEPPSIRDQNRERLVQDEWHTTYSSEAGFYLSETATLLEDLSNLFEENNVRLNDVNVTLSTLDEIRSRSESFIELDRPEAFDGFHHVHLSTLVEIDALRRILSDMKEPIHPMQLTNARVYYENAVMSHKQMEREYFSITEELGIH
jgi:hypothetical protein